MKLSDIKIVVGSLQDKIKNFSVVTKELENTAKDILKEADKILDDVNKSSFGNDDKDYLISKIKSVSNIVTKKLNDFENHKKNLKRLEEEKQKFQKEKEARRAEVAKINQEREERAKKGKK